MGRGMVRCEHFSDIHRSCMSGRYMIPNWNIKHIERL